MKFIEKLKQQYQATLPIRRCAVVGPLVLAAGVHVPVRMFEKRHSTNFKTLVERRFWGIIAGEWMIGKWVDTDVTEEPEVWDV